MVERASDRKVGMTPKCWYVETSRDDTMDIMKPTRGANTEGSNGDTRGSCNTAGLETHVRKPGL